jgi:hypothetical protein
MQHTRTSFDIDDLRQALRNGPGNRSSPNNRFSNASSPEFQQDFLYSLGRQLLGRPDEDLVNNLLADRSKGDEFLSQPGNGKGLVRCRVLRGRADEELAKGNLDIAENMFEEAARFVLGAECSFPVKAEALRNEVYVKLEAWERIEMMACCNGLAKCRITNNDVPKVLYCHCQLSTALPYLSSRPSAGWKRLMYCTKMAISRLHLPSSVSSQLSNEIQSSGPLTTRTRRMDGLQYVYS